MIRIREAACPVAPPTSRRRGARSGGDRRSGCRGRARGDSEPMSITSGHRGTLLIGRDQAPRLWSNLHRGRSPRKASQCLPWGTPLVVAGIALVVLRIATDSGALGRRQLTKEVGPMNKKLNQVPRKAVSAVRTAVRSTLETLWATGCSLLATAAVSS